MEEQLSKSKVVTVVHFPLSIIKNVRTKYLIRSQVFTNLFSSPFTRILKYTSNVHQSIFLFGLWINSEMGL